jgi:hypothetical protein
VWVGHDKPAFGGNLPFTAGMAYPDTMLNVSTCRADCTNSSHAPAEVLSRGTNCSRYNIWLTAQANSCRGRDRKLITPLPSLSEYKEAIHLAVVRSRGLDEYTGDLLQWNRLNHERPPAGGRKSHRKRGLWPSVDHYHGTGRLNYKICSGLTNTAKGALDHQEFVKLCRKVAARHVGWAEERGPQLNTTDPAAPDTFPESTAA